MGDHFRIHSLRACLAASIDAPFTVSSEVVLYQLPGGESVDGEGIGGGDALVAMQTWTFGSSFALPLRDGSVFVAGYLGDTDEAIGVSWWRLDLDG